MRKIELREITLRNWRGEKDRTTRFHTHRPTHICGDNGLGKSRHFDAFCWLLFGKDSQDRKDFELRTYDEHHNILHRCECSVEALLLIDGEELRIKREYKEDWVKPRGEVEEVFKGNVTECTWNGTPVNVGEFQSRVKEQIIDETVFKMLTNPHFFTERMKWQQQREVLLQMAGTKTDEQIAAGNEDFKALLDMLSGKSLTDYRRELGSRKKRLKADLDEIQPRIDQTQKMMPAEEDWEGFARQYKEASEKLNDIDKQLSDSTAQEEAEKQAVKGLRQQIANLCSKQDEVFRAHKQAEDQRADERNETRRSIDRKLKEAHDELSQLNIDRSRATDRKEYLESRLSGVSEQLESLRKEWFRINSSEYDGSETCPHCGQRLPEESISKAREIFAEHKRQELEANNKLGNAIAAQKEDYEKEIEKKRTEVEALDGKIDTAQKCIDNLYEELKNHPPVSPSYLAPENLSEWKELQDKIEELGKQIAESSKPSTVSYERENLISRRKEIEAYRSQLMHCLDRRDQIEQAQKEIARLEEQGRGLAQQIADLEKQEYTAAQFSKKKIEDCEQRINSMFSLVRFQLFDYTQEGNEFETCIPLVSGTPYAVANKAGRLNAGLDIINTLCRFNNISAPIFIDNSESSNHCIDTLSQMIFLRVTLDKELVIK